MKRKIVNILNKVLSGAGCALVPVYKTQSSVISANSYMQSPEYKQALVDELGFVAKQFFERRFPDLSPTGGDYGQAVDDFFAIYNQSPFYLNKGGSGFNSAFWLYLLSKLLNPRLIIESGVWKGQTTWLLEHACPTASIHGFDLDLGYVDQSRYHKAAFHASDWFRYNLPEGMEDGTLVFFDCHVNHARRIIEAHSKGIRQLVFDDNLPLHKLYIDGNPPIPTANMVYNWPENGPAQIDFFHKGKRIIEKIDVEQVRQAGGMITKHIVFPNVGDDTGFGGFSFLTYVELAGKQYAR